MRAIAIHSIPAIILAIFAPLAHAALSISVPSTAITQTQAVVEITSFSGPCTLELSTSGTYSPVVPDVDGTEYSGASTDTGRADTYTRSSGNIRVVTLGHMTDDRALTFETLYHLRVSGCGTTQTTTFTTRTLSQGTTRTEYVPFNSGKWGNLGYPTIDWHTLKTYTEPQTGALLTPIALHTLTWRTGGGASGAQSGFESFADIGGGATGWSNLSTIVNGSSTTAVASSTTAVDLYPDTWALASPITPYSPYRILEDIAAVVYGQASGTGADANINLSLRVHGVSCGSVTVGLPTGAVAHVTSGSGDPDGAFPSGFPSSPFFSWSGSGQPCIHEEDIETTGWLLVSGHTLTIPAPNAANNFPTTLVSGDRIKLAGSSCTNGLCTVASDASDNAVTATVVESPGDSPVLTVTGAGPTPTDLNDQMVLHLSGSTPSYTVFGAYVLVAGVVGHSLGNPGGTGCHLNGIVQVNMVGSSISIFGNNTDCAYDSGGTVTPMYPYKTYGWSIRVAKATNTGTVTVGLKYKLAGSNYPIGMQSGGDVCSGVSQVSGDGKTGYVCALTGRVAGAWYLAFVPQDGSAVRFIHFHFGAGITFSETDGNVFYEGATNAKSVSPPATGGKTVLRLTYTGDYTENMDFAYGCRGDSVCPAYNDHITVVDLMPYAQGFDVQQQIAAHQGSTLPAYNTSLYGSFDNANFEGTSGHFAVYGNIYDGQGQAPQGGGPAWGAVIDLSTAGADPTINPAQVVRLIHTLDGTGCANCRYGSAHSFQTEISRPNTFFASLDPLETNNPGLLHGGPYRTTVLEVLAADGVTWKANSSLPAWNAYDGSYLQTCPANSYGYTRCVTVHLPLGGPCNNAPSTAERAAEPACPWNAAYTLFPTIAPGDSATDLMGSINNVDQEHFRVLTSAPDSGKQKVVLARNATYEYCSLNPWHDSSSNPFAAQSPSQTIHADQWQMDMTPGALNSCGSAVILLDLVSGSVQELGHNVAGHFSMGVNGSNLNFITGGATKFNQPFSNLGAIPSVYNFTSSSFHGVGSGIGSSNGLQSYPESAHPAAPASGVRYGLDMSPYVSCFGEDYSCAPFRDMVHISGNVYKTGLWTAGQSNSTLDSTRVSVLQGWAGRYQLQDISGPGSDITACTYCMCVPGADAECHPSGLVNEQSLLFYGNSALNDASVVATTGNAGGHSFAIWIDATGTPDTFAWNVDNGAATTGVAITGSCQTLSLGFCVKFGATTGHTVNEKWISQNSVLAWINVPRTFDPPYNDGGFNHGLCVAGMSWANIPCLTLGFAAPADGIRRFRVSSSDTGSYVQLVTMGMSSQGRNYAFTHTTDYPTGGLAIQLGDHITDGFSYMPWLIKVPSWQEASTTGADFIQVPITAPNATYAEVRWGFSRYGGLPGDFKCTTRTEACNTRSSQTAKIHNFVSETRSLQSCSGGCTVNVPAVGPNLMSYQVFTSSDGVTFSPSGDIQTVAVGVPAASGPCIDFAYSPTSASVSSAGGTGTITATVTDQTCSTVNTSSQSWLTLTSATGGCSISAGQANCTGNGTFSWSAASNSGLPRNASITSDSLTTSFTLSEGGITCTFGIAPTSHTYAAAGAGTSVVITASDSSCPWTATYPDAWLSGSTSGTGSSTITVTAAANSGSMRTSTATIATQSFAATQSAAGGCTFSIAPTSNTYSAAGAALSVTITASSGGCGWTATYPDAWLTGPTSGTGTQTISVTAAANVGPVRTSFPTIATQTFSASQSDGCTFSLVPATFVYSAAGGGQSVLVSASNSGCGWTASYPDGWLSGPANGTGSQTITVGAAVNPGTVRFSSPTIAGQTYSASQRGFPHVKTTPRVRTGSRIRIQ